MKRLYRVSVEFEMVVEAENEMDAHFIAVEHAAECVSDSSPETAVYGVVKHAVELPDGWDEMCLPYGGDGEKRIGQILQEQSK